MNLVNIKIVWFWKNSHIKILNFAFIYNFTLDAGHKYIVQHKEHMKQPFNLTELLRLIWQL